MDDQTRKTLWSILDGAGLSCHFSRLIEHRFDREVCLLAEDEDWQDIGVPLQAAHAIRAAAVSTSDQLGDLDGALLQSESPPTSACRTHLDDKCQEGWTCPSCTFANSGLLSYCEMCDATPSASAEETMIVRTCTKTVPPATARNSPEQRGLDGGNLFSLLAMDNSSSSDDDNDEAAWTPRATLGPASPKSAEVTTKKRRVNGKNKAKAQRVAGSEQKEASLSQPESELEPESGWKTAPEPAPEPAESKPQSGPRPRKQPRKKAGKRHTESRGTSDENRRCAIGLKLAALQSRAAENDLFEFAALLGEFHRFLTCGDHAMLVRGYEMIVDGFMFGGHMSFEKNNETSCAKRITDAYDAACSTAQRALEGTRDPSRAAWLAADRHRTESILLVLASTSNFDFQHKMAGLTSANGIASIFAADHQHENHAKLLEFEATALERCRLAEKGWSAKFVAAAAAATAESAQRSAKAAWKQGKIFAAELLWTRVIALRDDCKTRTNRAHARTVLGRRMRSLAIGNFRPAVELLENAIRDAEFAIKLDPSWPRGYLRHAEALLALGPNEHAMAACRTLVAGLKRVDASGQPALSALLDRAKIAAKHWCPVKNTSPDKALGEALQSLEKVIVAGLSISQETDAALITYGHNIVDCVSTVAAILQAAYTNKSWVCSGRFGNKDSDRVQLELRKCAKCVSLSAVTLCEELKRCAFMEAPWTVFGLDRLDRIGKHELALGSLDPCRDDGKDELDEHMSEYLMRQTGSCPPGGVQALVQNHEMLRGKLPASPPEDMTPHNLCSFSCTLLQRIMLAKDHPLATQASMRIIELSNDQRGSWAGGDFLAYALTTAAGIGKHGIPSNLKRWNRFHRLDGAIAALATEVGQSGDSHGYIEKRLASISPVEWSKKSARDIQIVLLNHVLATLDGTMLRSAHETPNADTDHEHFCNPVCAPDELVPNILAAMLDGHPQLVTHLESAMDPATHEDSVNSSSASLASQWDLFDQAYTKFLPLFYEHSAFGVYLLKHFGERHTKKKIKHPNGTCSTRSTIKSLVRRWKALTFAEQAGYRWETFSNEAKSRLASAGFEPKPHVDVALHSKSGKTSGLRSEYSAVKIPSCSNCGKEAGPGVKLRKCEGCKLESYCSKKCQKVCWEEHKLRCRAIAKHHGSNESGSAG